MKRIIFSFVLLMPLLSMAQNPFDEYIGDYEVEKEDCSASNNPLFDPIKKVSIAKSGGDTFIEFDRSTSSSHGERRLNLSALNGVDSNSSDGAFFETSDKSMKFSIKKIEGSTYSFFDYYKADGHHDECTYTLKKL